jgi:hypothetical protein
MTEILTDGDLLFYMPEWVCTPGEPIWRIVMALGLKADAVGDYDGVRPIVDAEQRLLAVEMPSPATNGVPSEDVINSLREFLNEDEIVELINSFSHFEKIRQDEVEIELSA